MNHVEVTVLGFVESSLTDVNLAPRQSWRRRARGVARVQRGGARGSAKHHAGRQARCSHLAGSRSAQRPASSPTWRF